MWHGKFGTLVLPFLKVIRSIHVGGVPVSVNSYGAKTENYTVVASNNGGTIAWTTAGFSALLSPAATLGAGFRVTLVNRAATGDVTIDPDSAETLDGLATRLLRPGDRVTIESDGAGWLTLSGTYSYDTGVTPLTSKVGSIEALAHGLGMKPNEYYAEMICTGNPTSEQGYVIGDAVVVDPVPADLSTSGNFGVNMIPDATNITAVWGSSSVMSLFNRSTGISFTPTAAKWSWRLVARVRY